MKENIRDLRWRLQRLEKSIDNDPGVIAAKKIAREKIQSQVDEIANKINDLLINKPAPKSRWPEDTPEQVIKECKQHWLGTTEYGVFRIHAWNDRAVWTSYPAGGYSDNGGWHRTPASFYLISRIGLDQWGRRAKVLDTLEGRVSLKQMQQALIEKAQ